MSLKRFLAEREDTWDELQSLVDDAGTRPARLGSVRLLRLGRLYRMAVADLAHARQHYPQDPVVPSLEALVVRARAAVYAKPRRRTSIREFYTTGYWQLLMEKRRPLLLAAAAVLVPALLGFAYATNDPAAARSIVPEGFLWVTEPQPAGTDVGLDRGELTTFSTFVLVNNIRVTVTVFALGILFGFLSFGLMAYNGLLLGVVAGLAVDVGNSALLVEAVMAHGILEFSCIIVGGLAGFRLGSAMINPGFDPRRVAVAREAGPAALLALGTAPFLVLAGFIEGFVSRTGTSAGPSIVIGFLVGGAFWAAALLQGTQNRTRSLASR